MEIEEVDIRKVIPNPENPRFIRDENFEKLVRSIEEFPEMLKLRPIVVNEGMVTLGGNMRLRACKEAGLKKVPVIRVSLTKEQEKEFIIKDNLGYGEWDWEMLANEWDVELLNMWGLEVDLWKKDDDEEDEDGDEDHRDGHDEGGHDAHRARKVCSNLAQIAVVRDAAGQAVAVAGEALGIFTN